MALASTTVWEVRTGGSDTNGGGWVPGSSGTDWTQQDAAQYAVTDAVTNGTTTITSATANFGTDVVGNTAYIADGTASLAARWYRITARTNSTTITVDRTVAAGTGATLNIGGAFASIGQVGAVRVAGNSAFIKSGSYTISSASFNISGGCFDDTSSGQGGTSSFIFFTGYDTDRSHTNTDADRPVFTLASGVSNAIMFRVSGTLSTRFANLIVDGNLQTSSRGMQVGTAYLNVTERCLVRNCTNAGVNGGTHFGLEVTGCTTVAAINSAADLHACYIHDNSSDGMSFANNNTLVGTIFANNGGYGVQVTSSSGYRGVRFINCVAYNNTSGGFRLASTSAGTARYLAQYVNCIAYGNGGYGYGDAATANIVTFRNCAAGANTSGNFGITGNALGSVTLTADPFTDAANGDFSLNDTAGGGALLKGEGYPQTMPVV